MHTHTKIQPHTHSYTLAHTHTHLKVPVQVPELLHVGKSLDSSPALVGEKVHRADHVGGCREPEQEIQLSMVYLITL